VAEAVGEGVAPGVVAGVREEVALAIIVTEAVGEGDIYVVIGTGVSDVAPGFFV